jgi:hypothetical protein
VGLVRKRSWSGIYPMTEGQQFPRVGLCGLGATQFTADFPTDFLGYTIPCDVWFNWIGSPACWKNSLSTWQAMANSARSGSGVPFTESAIVAPAAVPLATTPSPVYSGNPADMSQYNQQTSDVLNAAMLQTQANLLQQAQDNSGLGPPSSDTSSLPTWVWYALGGAALLVVVSSGGRR